MTCDIRDRNLPCKAAAYQLVSKLGRGRVAKAAQSGIDVGDIKTLSDAISSILDVFHVSLISLKRLTLSHICVARKWHRG